MPRRNYSESLTNFRRRRYTLELLERREMLAADWQNPFQPLDVDNSGGAVSPLDALLVINELHEPRFSDPVTGSLPLLDESPPYYFDVDDNQVVSPLDALLVINGMFTNPTDEVDPPQATDSVIVGMPASHEDGIGHDTLVNTTTRAAQAYPDAASNASGNSVIVWASAGNSDSRWGVYGQLYDPAGAKIGEEFPINQFGKGNQGDPRVAMYEDGGFTVTWNSRGQDGSGWGVYARTFSADGTPEGDEFLVNATTKGAQRDPDVTTDGSTAYVVWHGRGDGDNNGVFLASIDRTSGDVSDESLVNTTTSGVQKNAQVSAEAGNVAIVWEGRGPDDRNGIFMTGMGPDLSVPEILVNESSSTAERFPAIDLMDNDVVVTWQQRRDNEPSWGVRARLYSDIIATDSSVDAGSISDVIHVNQTTRCAQRGSTVSFLDDGTFIVGWSGNGVGDRHGVFARQYAADGTPLTDEMLVNATTKSRQTRPSVVAAASGYIVVWEGFGEADRRGVYARFVETEPMGITVEIDPIADQTVNEGETVSFTATATVTGQESEVDLFWMLGSDAPDGSMIDSATGAFSWTTDEADGPGVYPVTISVFSNNPETNTLDFQDETTVTITVDEVNQPPVLMLTTNEVTVAVGETDSSVMASATDPDIPANTLTFSAELADGSPLPSWLTFNASTATLTAMPQQSDVGITVVRVSVSDGTASDSDLVSYTVIEEDLGFTFAVPDVTTNVDELLTIDLDDFVTFTNGSFPISYTVSNLPGWLIQDDSILSGTPGEGDAGATLHVATATGNGGSIMDGFSLTVNGAPSIIDQTFNIESSPSDGSFVGTVIANDPNPGDTLSFTITAGNDDSAFAIEEATGTITVLDGSLLTTGEMRSLTVTATDSGGLDGAGTITINIAEESPLAGYTLRAVDESGSQLDSLSPGQAFTLQLFATDLRPEVTGEGRGVFSAFADIIYSSSLVAVTGEITHDPVYGAGTSGDTITMGLIDEVGGVDGITPLGSDPRLVASIPMQATASGTALFNLDPADDVTQHPTLVFGGAAELTDDQISFGTLMLPIGTSSILAAPTTRQFAGSTSSAASTALAAGENLRSLVPISSDGSGVGRVLTERPLSNDFAPRRVPATADKPSDPMVDLMDQVFEELSWNR